MRKRYNHLYPSAIFNGPIDLACRHNFNGFHNSDLDSYDRCYDHGHDRCSHPHHQQSARPLPPQRHDRR